MAIVKATYTKSRAVIKASIRYIEHRSGKNGEKITRTLFSHDGEITSGQAYSMIDTTPNGIRHYRFVISPDPKREDAHKDLPLWELTTKTILELEERLHQAIPFIAAEHNDHTDIRHVHVIAPISGKLTRQDLQYLRDRATAVSLFQRREKDLAQGRGQERGGQGTQR